MNLQQASELLGINQDDDEREIKRKYHKMISLFHPDSVDVNEQDGEYIRRAQEINEAYRILSQNGKAQRTKGAAAAHNPRKQRQPNQEAQNPNTRSQNAQNQWSTDVNEGAFTARNIYMHYSMDLSQEEKAASAEKLFYQAARGKYMWDPEEEDFSLFLTSIRHASADVLEQIENTASVDLTAIPDLKEYRFRTQAKLFEYLSMQYVNPVKVLDSLVKPESTDGKGQRIYHFKAFLTAPPQTAESTRIAQLQPGEYLYPRAFHGNQIQLMNKDRQVLGYLHMEDDRLYFCIIPLLKRHAAQVKLLVKSDGKEEQGMHQSKYTGSTRRSGRSYTGSRTAETDIDFYFRLEDESYNSTDLNLKIAELLSEYEKYLQQGRFSDLFQRLARSNFRSRFHLKEKDRQYIQEKGMDTIRSHARDFVRTRLAPAQIPNDGKQTPMRGHPVFLAQHATGCCCRGCLYKWHRIPQGVQLTQNQQDYVVDVLMTWIEKENTSK